MAGIYLTTEEVAARWDGAVSSKTLANWRLEPGRSPPYQKFGGRIIYPLAALEAWERDNLYGSTREYPERPSVDQNRNAKAGEIQEAALATQREALLAEFDLRLEALRQEYAARVATLAVMHGAKRPPGRPKGSRDKAPRRMAQTSSVTSARPDSKSDRAREAAIQKGKRE